MDNRLLLELQMLTGVYTEDMDYLMFLLLKDGVYFSENNDTSKSSIIDNSFIGDVQDVNDWFKNI